MSPTWSHREPTEQAWPRYVLDAEQFLVTIILEMTVMIFMQWCHTGFVSLIVFLESGIVCKNNKQLINYNILGQITLIGRQASNIP